MHVDTTGTTREAMRLANRRAVLSCFLDGGRRSRTELAKLTGLAAPTLSGITNELIAAGTLREAGQQAPSTGGRRPTLLELDPSFGHVAGIDLGRHTITLTIVDASGGTVHVAERAAPEDLLDDALALYEQHAPPSRRLGLGISAPGIVDLDRRVVRLSSSLGWRDYPLLDELTRRTTLPAILENDGACAAFAEWKAMGTDAPQDMLYLAFRLNIAGGLVLGGAIHRGSHGAAAEMGHFVPGRERLGRYGHGAGASSYLFDAAWLEARLGATAPGMPVPQRVADLFGRAYDGVAVIEDLRNEILENLAVIVANSTALLDLPCVMLGGVAFHGNDRAADGLRDMVHELVPAPPVFVQGRLGDGAAALGAAALARESALARELEALR